MRVNARDKDASTLGLLRAPRDDTYIMPGTVHHGDEEGQKSIYQRLVHRNLSPRAER